jgi:hypothetical protein
VRGGHGLDVDTSTTGLYLGTRRRGALLTNQRAFAATLQQQSNPTRQRTRSFRASSSLPNSKPNPASSKRLE